ncbi:Cilia- and flagella-associated protein 251, partial [Coelomomyces lativittatus]
TCTCCLWEWTQNTKSPTFELALPTTEIQSSFSFVPHSSTTLLSNGSHTILSYHPNDDNTIVMLMDSTTTTTPSSTLTCSCFLNSFHWVVGTTSGDVHVWAYQFNSKVWHPSKTLHHIHGSSISAMVVAKNVDLIVIASTNGVLKIFDFSFRLVSLIETFKSTSITHLSFYSSGSLLDSPPLPSLLVATAAGAFYRLSYEGRSFTSYPLKTSPSHSIHTFTCHPRSPMYFFGTLAGHVYAYTFPFQLNWKILFPHPVSHLVVHPNGDHLCVFLSNGEMMVVDMKGVTISSPILLSPNVQVHLTQFSPSSTWLIAIDHTHAMTCFSCMPYTVHHRYRAHHAEVIGLWFLQEAICSTISMDGTWYQFSWVPEWTCTLRHTFSASPITMTEVPNDPEKITVAMDTYHLITVNAQTTVYRNISLAPMWSKSPIHLLRQGISEPTQGNKEMTYHWHVFAMDQMVGVILEPFDGNPHRTMGVIGHSEKLSHLVISPTQPTMVITVSKATMKQWRLHPEVIDWQQSLTQSNSNDKGPPIFELLELTQDPHLMHHLETLFYNAQLRNAKHGSTSPSSLGTGVFQGLSSRVHLSQLPSLMRAIGYFPSEIELQRLLHLVELRSYEHQVGQDGDDEKKDDGVTLKDWLTLYWNHREVNPLTEEQVIQYIHLAKSLVPTEMEVFLKTYGEPLSDEEYRRFEPLLLQLSSHATSD